MPKKPRRDQSFENLEKNAKEEYENELSEFYENGFDRFEEKRLVGENDSYICQLIRNDMIDDFIIYVNKTNMSLFSTIKPSVFETNSFLLNKKNVTLIEYASFFGSIQIFNYLKLNNVELTPPLWLYVIHSNNAEMIHVLEENQIKPEGQYFSKCLKESIKCHHNDIATYIQNNLLNQKIEDENDFFGNSLNFAFHYYNYKFIPNIFDNQFIPFYICKYRYIELSKILLTDERIDVNISTISNKKYF